MRKNKKKHLSSLHLLSSRSIFSARSQKASRSKHVVLSVNSSYPSTAIVTKDTGFIFRSNSGDIPASSVSRRW